MPIMISEADWAYVNKIEDEIGKNPPKLGQGSIGEIMNPKETRERYDENQRKLEALLELQTIVHADNYNLVGPEGAPEVDLNVKVKQMEDLTQKLQSEQIAIAKFAKEMVDSGYKPYQNTIDEHVRQVSPTIAKIDKVSEAKKAKEESLNPADTTPSATTLTPMKQTAPSSAPKISAGGPGAGPTSGPTGGPPKVSAGGGGAGDAKEDADDNVKMKGKGQGEKPEEKKDEKYKKTDWDKFWETFFGVVNKVGEKVGNALRAITNTVSAAYNWNKARKLPEGPEKEYYKAKSAEHWKTAKKCADNLTGFSDTVKMGKDWYYYEHPEETAAKAAKERATNTAPKPTPPNNQLNGDLTDAQKKEEAAHLSGASLTPNPNSSENPVPVIPAEQLAAKQQELVRQQEKVDEAARIKAQQEQVKEAEKVEASRTPTSKPEMNKPK